MTSIILIPDQGLDLVLDDIIANGNLVHLTGEVTAGITYAQVLAASIGNYVPVISKSDLTAGGRKATLAAKTGVVIDTSTNFAGIDKSFDQFIIVDTVNSVIKYIGKGIAKNLSDTDTVNVPAANINNPDIVAVA
jgi:hypothetical protein